jgi:uncharacterized protein (TIGR03546 family)
MFTLLRTVRLTLKGLSKLPDGRAVALGVAIGLAVGIVPKGNLLALALGVLLCSLRLSLVAGLAVAVFVSFSAHHADPLFNAVGEAVLEFEPLRPLWTRAAALPFSDWSQFNNTVTMGSFLVGCLLIYPVYRLLRPPLERFLPALSLWVKRSLVMRLWARFEFTGRLASAADADGL